MNKGVYFALSGTIIFAALLAIYYALDPAEYELIPKCPVKMITGFDCPSCGNQRALHALLHGDVWTACKFNLFAVYSVPYFIAVLICCFSSFKNHTLIKIKRWILSKAAAYFYIAAYLAWWILRNIL